MQFYKPRVIKDALQMKWVSLLWASYGKTKKFFQAKPKTKVSEMLQYLRICLSRNSMHNWIIGLTRKAIIYDILLMYIFIANVK